MTLDKLFSQYGREAELHSEDGWNSGKFRCFIQPLRYKNKMYLDGVNTPIGYNSQGHYLYIGPANHDLTGITDSSTWIASDSIKYKVDRSEKVYFGNQVLYIWAIIKTIVEV